MTRDERKSKIMNKLNKYFNDSPPTKSFNENNENNENEENEKQLILNELIVRLRNEFLSKAEQNPADYDECDIERVKHNEFTVKRFVLWNKLNYEKSFQQLDNCMKWRKTSGVNSKSEIDAPQEFFKAGAIFHCGFDKNDLPVIYFRAKTVLKIEKLKQIYHMIGVNVINKIDLETNGRGFINVLDLTDVSYKNADLNLIQFVIEILRKYFPLSIHTIIIYNLPWYLRGFVPVVKMWLASHEQELLKFVNGFDSLCEYIDKEQIPMYLGGGNQLDFTKRPDGCRRCQSICDLYGFTQEECAKYMKLFQPFIDEGEQLVKIKNDKICHDSG